MSKSMLSVPCTFENEILNIKGLGVHGKGSSLDEAFFNAIKNSPELYSDLCVGKITEEKGRYSLIVNHSKKLYDRILEIEPLPFDKSKAKKEGLLKATSEEVVKYGYEG